MGYLFVVRFSHGALGWRKRVISCLINADYESTNLGACKVYGHVEKKNRGLDSYSNTAVLSCGDLFRGRHFERRL